MIDKDVNNTTQSRNPNHNSNHYNNLGFLPNQNLKKFDNWKNPKSWLSCLYNPYNYPYINWELQ